jgi:hypothetical protein
MVTHRLGSAMCETAAKPRSHAVFIGDRLALTTAFDNNASSWWAPR